MNTRLWFLAFTVGFLPALSWAQTMPADVAGGKDYPVLSRYAGSWLVATETKEFDEAAFPSGPNAGDLSRLEGRLTRLYYVAPAGRSVLEVQRNYEQALEKAGAVRRDSCAMPVYGARNFRFFEGRRGQQMAIGRFEGWGAQTMVDQWIDHNSVRWWYGTLNVQGATLHVLVMSAKQGLVALADKHVSTLVQIVQPQAMETGKVTVDASALAQGLQADGKMALYGIYFDSDKTELKPESKLQLDEMAKMLQGNSALRVFIVGHTDNQGALEKNLACSRARAQAVVDALVRTHNVDAKRLGAAGVANYALVAGNGDEASREKNRRVEMVLQ